ncbi:PAS and helix-turn-helix domain-containing protein [bacterium]|nr:PAS and helix-turn-helix domain-containing protein [bacterium]
MPLPLTPAPFSQWFRTADGAVAVDVRTQKVVWWNREALRILGSSSRRLRGAACYRVFCGKNRTGRALCRRNCAVVRAARAGRTVRDFDMIVGSKSGRDAWVNMSLLLVPKQSPRGGVILHLFRKIQSREPGAGAESFLTARENEILSKLAEGIPSREIAVRFGIRYATIRTHIQHILSKLGVRSILQAILHLQYCARA